MAYTESNFLLPLVIMLDRVETFSWIISRTKKRLDSRKYICSLILDRSERGADHAFWALSLHLAMSETI